MAEVFPPQKFPELFFALVAPIGTDLESSERKLTEKLVGFGYIVVPIKVTDVFHPLHKYTGGDLALKPLEKRFASYIAFGDSLRKRFGEDAFLAYTCIQQICFARVEAVKRHGLDEPQRLAYVLRQFKRKEEIDLLRSIYGRSLFQVSIHSRRSSRVDNLSRKIASSNNSTSHNNFRAVAEGLVATDENESSDPNGQRVSDVFHETDFIVDSNADDRGLSDQIARFVDLIFGSNSLSPTKAEYGLYAAKSASLRTLDLSRQVGVSIFSKEGEIISIGANEVPKAGGGTYWGDDSYDDRDFKRQGDSNERRKREILAELVQIIAPGRIAEELLSSVEVKKSQFMDALEYGRIIHAEMSAICDAARLGRPLKGATLYTTTFPCHMCAKHIVAAGLECVEYLEPYPKSLASDLHSDSILIDGQSRDKYEDYPKVTFRHFCGVSPRRYRDFFERRKRKTKDGDFQQWMLGSPRPIVEIRQSIGYLSAELAHVEAVLVPALQTLGMKVDELRPERIVTHPEGEAIATD